MLRDALKLWTTSAPYKNFPCETVAWRLLPAIDNEQIRLFNDGPVDVDNENIRIGLDGQTSLGQVDL